MKEQQAGRSLNWPIILCGGMFLIFVGLLFRDLGLYASVFGDEWTYSTYSRLWPAQGSSIPSFLYLWIYRITNQCGPDFLGCARVLNAALFVTAAPFIYVIFGKFTSPGKAACLAMLSMAAPVNTYSAYFMPEALYFLMFWIFAWIALNRSLQAPWCYGLESGLMLGLMCLVKVHALFLLGAFAAFVLADAAYSVSWRALWSAGVAILAAASAFFAVRFGLGYLLAGDSGLHLLGALYTSQAQTSRSLHTLLHNTMLSGVGHVLGLSLLFGPLFVGSLAILAKRGSDETLAQGRRAVLFMLVVLGSLVCVTAYFTGMVSSPVGGESAYRLHMRYYNFCFPGLLLGALAWRGRDLAPRWYNWLIAGLATCLSLLAIFASTRGLAHFTPYLIDAPELAWYAHGSRWAMAMGWLAAVGCFSFLARDFQLSRRWAIGYHVGVVLVTTWLASSELHHDRAVLDSYARAGQIVKLDFPNDAGNTQFIGEDIFGLFKARFYLDAPAAEVTVLPKDRGVEAVLDRSRNPIVVFGKQELPAGTYANVRNYADFHIYNMAGDWDVDFRDLALPATVRSLSGFSGVEFFGRWSAGKEVVITFKQPMPEHFKLVFTAMAFGPNAKLPFVFNIGGSTKSLNIVDTTGTYSMDFDIAKGVDTIRVTIPQPVSPKQLGLGSDPRMLGIALSNLHIRPLPRTPRQ